MGNGKGVFTKQTKNGYIKEEKWVVNHHRGGTPPSGIGNHDVLGFQSAAAKKKKDQPRISGVIKCAPTHYSDTPYSPTNSTKSLLSALAAQKR
jgi:hypothetical protein